MPRIALAALAAALAAAAAVPALADSAGGGGGTQVVQGTVAPQFGISIAPDGTITTAATTIPATVTRTRVRGVEVITIAPAG